MIHTEIKLPELLSPAGNPEKLEAAIRFGANAVYLSGTRFGMRAAADNFQYDDLKNAIQYCHQFEKKVYITVNVMPRHHEFPALEGYLEELGELKPDGVIVADLGVFSLCCKKIPDIPIHISTQAATVNAYSCLKWFEMGAKRIVLARELSFSDIAAIRSAVPDECELEAFIHGSMCVSFSGRCMLSEFYTGRDANRGACTQPCRWQYRFAEEKRPNDILTAEIHPEGTYIFGSKDLCMIDYVKQLSECGISSLKIEGRMKSAYYTAVVTNAYRIALSEYKNNCTGKSIELLHRELESVSHREYCTGYYFDEAMKNCQFADTTGYLGEKSYLCSVEEYDEKRGLAKCKQRNKFHVGDICEYITPGKCGEPLTILQMLDEFGNEISSCPHPQQIFYIKTDKKLSSGDLIRK